MKNIIALAAVATVAVATPAMAEDFAGAYIGAGVTVDNLQGSGDAEGLGLSGIGGTIFTGYDLPVGDKAFAGVEANADLNSADAFGLEADWSWGVSGRLGYKLNDSSALYARVGYAQTRLSDDIDHEWFEGVRYGVGLQTGLTDTISLRAEFSQFNFEDSLINNQGSLSLSYGF